MKLNTNTLKGLLTHLAVLIGLFSLLSFSVFYVVLPRITNKDKVVTVPDLKGMSLNDARAFVNDKDVAIEVIDSSYDLSLAPLVVLSQFPDANSKVKIGRKINVTLNARIPPLVAFPDLSSSTYELAKQQLESLDLKIGKIQYRQDLANNIILDSKLDGELLHIGQEISKGSSIDLTIGSY